MDLKAQWKAHFSTAPRQLERMKDVRGVASVFNANIDAVLKVHPEKLLKWMELLELDEWQVLNTGPKKISEPADLIRGFIECFSKGVAQEWLVGYVSPSSDPAALSAGGRPMALGHARETPTLKQQFLRFLLKALLGFGPRSEAVRMLFADPRDFFFIWEDQARDPLTAPGTRTAAMAAMVLAGLWSLVFFTLAAASATQKLDEVVLMGLGLLAVLI